MRKPSTSRDSEDDIMLQNGSWPHLITTPIAPRTQHAINLKCDTDRQDAVLCAESVSP